MTEISPGSPDTRERQLDHLVGRGRKKVAMLRNSHIRRSDERGKNSTKRPRIQLDFPVETFEELEALAVKVGATSVNEFTRGALRFYRWFLENKEKGYQLMVEKDGKAAVVELLF